MPKRHQARESVSETVTTPEPKTKKTAAKPMTPAATHKRKSSSGTKASSAAKQPIRPTHEQIAALAYSFFAARGYQHGLHVEDWLRAERELLLELS